MTPTSDVTATDVTASGKTAQVWDLGVRLFHWSLVAMVAGAYMTEEYRKIHRYLGYAVLALIGFRLFWGVTGSYHARFVTFIPGPARLIAYLRDIVAGKERRYIGHNPAGAAMILALLATLGAIGATGYMMGMDRYFGQTWVENTHELLVDGLIILVLLHLGGVLLASHRHSENLVRAMLTGRKSLDDPSRNH